MPILILALILLAAPAFGDDPALKWTRLGKIVVVDPDGNRVSTHYEREKAYQSANNHAWASGNTGDLEYEILFPRRKFVISIPERYRPPVFSDEPEPPTPDPLDDGRLLEANAVYVCPPGPNNGATVEPAGKPGNDGASPDSPLHDPNLVGSRSPGTDVYFCEGAKFYKEFRLLHSGERGLANEVALTRYHANQSVALTDPHILNNPFADLYDSPLLASYGFDKSRIDPVNVWCYQNLNGVYRPCQNAMAHCESESELQCID